MFPVENPRSWLLPQSQLPGKPLMTCTPGEGPQNFSEYLGGGGPLNCKSASVCMHTNLCQVIPESIKQ